MSARRPRSRTHVGLPFALFLVLLGLVVFAAVNSGSNLLFWIASMLVAALLVSSVVVGGLLRRLHVRRIAPTTGVVGRPLVLRYEIDNGSRLLPVFNIHVEESAAPPANWPSFAAPVLAWVMHVGPGERVHGEAEIRPTRRGVLELEEVRWRSEFPFGMFSRSLGRAQRQRILVHPRIHALRPRVLRVIAPHGTLGSVVSSASGPGDDYYGLREFRPGDSLRQVAWKATANRDQMVAIERSPPHPPRLRLVLHLDPGDDEPLETRRLREESAICIIASVAHAADAAGYEIGLSVLGLAGAPLPLAGGYWHRQRFMGALAELDLEGERVIDVRNLPDSAERAGVLVVHAGPIEPDVVPMDAWHLTATRMDDVLERRDTGEAPA